MQRKRYHSDKHFSEFLPTGGRQKSTGTKFTSLSPCVFADSMPIYLFEMQLDNASVGDAEQ